MYNDLVCIHIPKAGGTSIEKMILEMNKKNNNYTLYLKIYER